MKPPQYASIPLRRMLRPSKPYACRSSAQCTLLPVAVDAMNIYDARDRQTSVAHHRLIPPPYLGGGIKSTRHLKTSHRVRESRQMESAVCGGKQLSVKKECLTTIETVIHVQWLQNWEWRQKKLGWIRWKLIRTKLTKWMQRIQKWKHNDNNGIMTVSL